MEHTNGTDTARVPVIICVATNSSGNYQLCSQLEQYGVLTPNCYGKDTYLTYDSYAMDKMAREVLAELGGTDSVPASIDSLVKYIQNHDTVNNLVDKVGALVKTALDRIADERRQHPDTPRAAAIISDSIPSVAYLWRKAIRYPLAAIILTENPKDTLNQPSDTSFTNSEVFKLAAYERTLRNALLAFNGLPTLILDKSHLNVEENDFGHYLDKLLEICVSTKEKTCDIFEAGTYRKSPSRTQISLAITGEAPKNVASPVLWSQSALYELCQANSGIVDTLNFADEIADEDPWTQAVLQLGQDVVHTFSGLNWAVKQIEPILRLPAPSELVPIGKAQLDAIQEDGRSLEGMDATEIKRAYPLNASEDRRAYHRWLKERHLPVNVNDAFQSNRPLKKARAKKNPLISVLVPVWKTPLWALERCVESVLHQTFPNFELIVCDDHSGLEEITAYLNSAAKRDMRIKVIALKENGGISKATNAALAMAKGEFVAFLDHDDELELQALEEVAKAIAENGDADVIYSDEDKIDAHGERFDPLFKPEWSPDLLLSFAYICHLTTIRRKLVLELGGLRPEFDGSQDYDLTLRATEKARKIIHISEVLYHWRTLPGSAAGDSPNIIAKPWAYTAGLRAIEDALARRDEEGKVTDEPAFPGRYHVLRKPKGEPLVSIIIPFRDEPSLLATCCDSLQQNPGYQNFEFILADNGSELPETFTLLEKLTSEYNATVVSMPGPFNWARINNSAVDKAKGDILLFSNNDIEARSSGWLYAMLGHATRNGVGAVGARLLYPDGGIQHAGVVVGLGGIAGHVLRGLPGTYPGYNSMAIQTRNCSVVTGACMMTRREAFERVGGFDENLPVAFNDVDFCLKLIEDNYLVIYEPLAELIHYESKSRGHTDDLAESARIIERWGHIIVAGDPYLNKNLSHWRYWCPLSTAQENDRWNNYLETSVLTR